MVQEQGIESRKFNTHHYAGCLGQEPDARQASVSQVGYNEGQIAPEDQNPSSVFL